MKITKEGNLYQLTFFPGIFPVNCYLLEESSGLTLIDAALPSGFKGIMKAIKQIGKPLTNIVLTHAHGDHVGALDDLKQAFPDVPVSISVRDSRLLLGDKTLDSQEAQLPIKGGIPKNVKTKPDYLLQEGERIGSLQVIATPGHTPGSVSFFNLHSKQIIAGDALQTKGRMAVCGQIVPSFPFPAFGTWNKELAIESVKKILDLKPSLLAIGHGKMIDNPVSSMQVAIKQAEGNMNKKEGRKNVI
ncbi:MBL fold metallo-hydrolase [Oceanobacillus piezotolerans]|uniref:MBL fold metallo-hydrolase n=1 Tax=Oceanobacillus piezotolerans TaxID=2448030 RepID=A0A498D565_9BACI|nr:MBL fold metallo-hydrolase [Oceanobacillus piezotolerans]RLL43753.1 MBL fold metallo-hydrolase [Oceanobacillus piezotolerans]